MNSVLSATFAAAMLTASSAFADPGRLIQEYAGRDRDEYIAPERWNEPEFGGYKEYVREYAPERHPSDYSMDSLSEYVSDRARDGDHSEYVSRVSDYYEKGRGAVGYGASDGHTYRAPDTYTGHDGSGYSQRTGDLMYTAGEHGDDGRYYEHVEREYTDHGHADEPHRYAADERVYEDHKGTYDDERVYDERGSGGYGASAGSAGHAYDEKVATDRAREYSEQSRERDGESERAYGHHEQYEVNREDGGYRPSERDEHGAEREYVESGRSGYVEEYPVDREEDRYFELDRSDRRWEDIYRVHDAEGDGDEPRGSQGYGASDGHSYRTADGEYSRYRSEGEEAGKTLREYYMDEGRDHIYYRPAEEERYRDHERYGRDDGESYHRESGRAYEWDGDRRPVGEQYRNEYKADVKYEGDDHEEDKQRMDGGDKAKEEEKEYTAEGNDGGSKQEGEGAGDKDMSGEKQESPKPAVYT